MTTDESEIMAPAGPAQHGATRAESPSAIRLAAAGAALSAGEAAAQSITRFRPQVTEAQAVRFLAQASFGANEESIKAVVAAGYWRWIDDQFTKPQTLHRAYLESVIDPALPQQVFRDAVLDSFWTRAITGADQLRQRLAFALSEIFVVSQVSAPVNQRPRGLADYLDMLGREGFGNFRSLIERVSLHPIMGLYLSHLRNQKEDPTTGRVPDENYAREVMQLFTIGLYQLNPDGTSRLDGKGQKMPTYSNDDVMGLARVFTGFSWAGPDTSNQRFFGGRADPDRDVLPMQPYAQFHSMSEKRFLGVAIPAGTGPADSLRVALDTLFDHPNVGPFFGRQLIQRLVTSNPSPDYVRRVAAAFDDNGRGVRGDMKSVLRAVLLDVEARSDRRLASPDTGRLREPVLRLAAWARAFEATSASGAFRIRDTSDPSTRLGQAPLRSPSVFNFFRPGYVPPNTAIAAAGLVAPEFQITGETSVAGYLNYMRAVIANGAGAGADVRSSYTDEVALAVDPQQLVDRVALLLTANQLSETTRNAIRDAVAAIRPTAPNAMPNRARLAVFLVMASPEFLVIS
jgi:uncharacterized protein (DUF1800 family)